MFSRARPDRLAPRGEDPLRIYVRDPVRAGPGGMWACDVNILLRVIIAWVSWRALLNSGDKRTEVIILVLVENMSSFLCLSFYFPFSIFFFFSIFFSFLSLFFPLQ